MEIHAPHQPVHSVKDMLVHLALVTLGVLIALSFEGVGSWREHRALVYNARANILNELRDNRKELDGVLKSLAGDKAGFAHTAVVVQKVMDHKSIEGESVQLHLTTVDLRSASRTTAEITGAFALMEYDEVKKYASLYGFQEQFLRMQSDTFQHFTRAFAPVDILDHPETASARELEDWKAAIRVVIASMEAGIQLGQGLLKEYDRVLQPN